MTNDRHYCPKCGAGLVSEPIGAPYRCKHCGWHLISRTEWKKLSPHDQGYAHYMQASWPTSELASEENPYAKGTRKHEEFCRGQSNAVLAAQDSEE